MSLPAAEVLRGSALPRGCGFGCPGLVALARQCLRMQKWGHAMWGQPHGRISIQDGSIVTADGALGCPVSLLWAVAMLAHAVCG